MSKVILSSTNIDSHGEQMTKEALESAVEIINSIQKVKWSIEHKREIPPLGYIGNAEVIPYSNGHLLQGETVKHDFIKEVEWDSNLLIEGFNEPIVYNEVDANEKAFFSVSVDHNNIASYSDFELLNQEFKSLFNVDVDLQTHVRKSHIPSPELVIIIDSIKWGLLLFNPFAKKFCETIGEKLAEDFYVQTKKEAKKLRDIIIRFLKLTRAKSTPKNKVLKTVLSIPGKPHIELIASDDSGDILLKGLSSKSINQMYKDIEVFKKHCEVVKIQFVLSQKGKWVFNYLYTQNGETIGTKIIFKERERLIKKLEMNQRK